MQNRQFSEILLDRFLKMMGTHMRDFNFPEFWQCLFQRWVVPSRAPEEGQSGMPMVQHVVYLSYGLLHATVQPLFCVIKGRFWSLSLRAYEHGPSLLRQWTGQPPPKGGKELMALMRRTLWNLEQEHQIQQHLWELRQWKHHQQQEAQPVCTIFKGQDQVILGLPCLIVWVYSTYKDI